MSCVAILFRLARHSQLFKTSKTFMKINRLKQTANYISGTVLRFQRKTSSVLMKLRKHWTASDCGGIRCWERKNDRLQPKSSELYLLQHSADLFTRYRKIFSCIHRFMQWWQRRLFHNMPVWCWTAKWPFLRESILSWQEEWVRVLTKHCKLTQESWIRITLEEQLITSFQEIITSQLTKDPQEEYYSWKTSYKFEIYLL